METLHIPTKEEITGNTLGRNLFLAYIALGVVMLIAYFQPTTLLALLGVVAVGVVFSIT